MSEDLHPKFARLVLGGVIQDEGQFTVEDRTLIEQTFSDDEITALIKVKVELEPRFGNKDLGCGLGHLIVF